jgi:hypothetical protein
VSPFVVASDDVDMTSELAGSDDLVEQGYDIRGKDSESRCLFDELSISSSTSQDPLQVKLNQIGTNESIALLNIEIVLKNTVLLFLHWCKHSRENESFNQQRSSLSPTNSLSPSLPSQSTRLEKLVSQIPYQSISDIENWLIHLIPILHSATSIVTCIRMIETVETFGTIADDSLTDQSFKNALGTQFLEFASKKDSKSRNSNPITASEVRKLILQFITKSNTVTLNRSSTDSPDSDNKAKSPNVLRNRWNPFYETKSRKEHHRFISFSGIVHNKLAEVLNKIGSLCKDSALINESKRRIKLLTIYDNLHQLLPQQSYDNVSNISNTSNGKSIGSELNFPISLRNFQTRDDAQLEDIDETETTICMSNTPRAEALTWLKLQRSFLEKRSNQQALVAAASRKEHFSSPSEGSKSFQENPQTPVHNKSFSTSIKDSIIDQNRETDDNNDAKSESSHESAKTSFTFSTQLTSSGRSQASFRDRSVSVSTHQIVYGGIPSRVASPAHLRKHDIDYLKKYSSAFIYSDHIVSFSSFQILCRSSSPSTDESTDIPLDKLAERLYEVAQESLASENDMISCSTTCLEVVKQTSDASDSVTVSDILKIVRISNQLFYAYLSFLLSSLNGDAMSLPSFISVLNPVGITQGVQISYWIALFSLMLENEPIQRVSLLVIKPSSQSPLQKWMRKILLATQESFSKDPQSSLQNSLSRYITDLSKRLSTKELTFDQIFEVILEPLEIYITLSPRVELSMALTTLIIETFSNVSDICEVSLSFYLIYR